MSRQIREKILEVLEKDFCIEVQEGYSLKFEIYLEGILYDITKYVKENSDTYTRNLAHDNGLFKADTLDIGLLLDIKGMKKELERFSEGAFRSYDELNSFFVQEGKTGIVVENSFAKEGYGEKYRVSYDTSMAYYALGIRDCFIKKGSTESKALVHRDTSGNDFTDYRNIAAPVEDRINISRNIPSQTVAITKNYEEKKGIQVILDDASQEKGVLPIGINLIPYERREYSYRSDFIEGYDTRVEPARNDGSFVAEGLFCRALKDRYLKISLKPNDETKVKQATSQVFFRGFKTKYLFLDDITNTSKIEVVLGEGEVVVGDVLYYVPPITIDFAKIQRETKISVLFDLYTKKISIREGFISISKNQILIEEFTTGEHVSLYHSNDVAERIATNKDKQQSYIAIRMNTVLNTLSIFEKRKLVTVYKLSVYDVLFFVNYYPYISSERPVGQILQYGHQPDYSIFSTRGNFKGINHDKDEEVFFGKIRKGNEVSISKKTHMSMKISCEEIYGDSSFNSISRILPRVSYDILNARSEDLAILSNRYGKYSAYPTLQDILIDIRRDIKSVVNFNNLSTIEEPQLLEDIHTMMKVFISPPMLRQTIYDDRYLKKYYGKIKDAQGNDTTEDNYDVSERVLVIEASARNVCALNKCCLSQSIKSSIKNEYPYYWLYDLTKTVWENLIENRETKFFMYRDYNDRTQITSGKETTTKTLVVQECDTEVLAAMIYLATGDERGNATTDEVKTAELLTIRYDDIANDIEVNVNNPEEYQSTWSAKIYNRNLGGKYYDIFALITTFSESFLPKIKENKKEWRDVEKDTEHPFHNERSGNFIEEKGTLKNLFNNFLYEEYLKRKRISFTTTKNLRLGMVYRLQMLDDYYYLIFVNQISYSIMKAAKGKPIYKVKASIIENRNIGNFCDNFAGQNGDRSNKSGVFFNWDKNFKRFVVLKVSNKEELQAEITRAIKEQGNEADLNYIDTSEVTDMSRLFSGNTTFNGDISEWDTSSVTNMNSMFSGATSFNQPLDNWTVSSVTNMNSMFYGATSFNQPLDNWTVSSVTNMSGMFYGATSFNQPLNKWNVSSVRGMYSMFAETRAFNQPLNKWNVSSVTEMNFMFYNATNFNQDISGWQDNNERDSRNMFDGAKAMQEENKPSWARDDE